MAERSMLWNSGTGDGPPAGHTQQHWLELLRDLFTTDRYASEGVIAGMSNELRQSVVNGASPSITIQPGGAMVYGFYYQNTSNLSLALTKPSVGTTGGRVVLRADWTLQTARMIARQSADGTSAPPSIIQSAGSQFEIPMATYTITTGGTITLVDVRDFCHPGALVYRRAGGDGANWNVAGNTIYTPGGSLLQCGSVSVPFPSSADSTLTTVAFGAAFGANPIVIPATYNNGSSTGRRVLFTVETISPTQFQVRGRETSGNSTGSSFDCWWFALGPEA